MKKIAIVGMWDYDNVGDVAICETVEWIVLKKCHNAEVVRVNMNPWNELNLSLSQRIIHRSLEASYKVTRKCFPNSSLTYFLGKKDYRLLAQCAEIKRQMIGVHGIIIACGMFKYGTQNLNFMYEYILSIAKEMAVPVLFDAMGIEKYDYKNYRARKLREALNNGCTKMFITREGDVGKTELDGWIDNNAIQIDAVGDPAYWANECYNIPPRTKNNSCVGIGLIRPTIFQNYLTDKITEKQVVSMYKGLVRYLDQSGIEWHFFTNGLNSDYLFGEKLIKEMNLPEEKLMKRPQTGKELALQISSFAVVLAARLHSCIFSYSLGVPFVGFNWTEKIPRVFNFMGLGNSCVNTDQFNDKYIFEKLMDARDVHIDEKLREEHKSRTLKSICAFIENV